MSKKKRLKMQNAASFILHEKKSQNQIEGHLKSSATDPKAVYYFTCCTTDYNKILEVGKKTNLKVIKGFDSLRQVTDTPW